MAREIHRIECGERLVRLRASASANSAETTRTQRAAFLLAYGFDFAMDGILDIDDGPHDS